MSEQTDQQPSSTQYDLSFRHRWRSEIGDRDMQTGDVPFTPLSREKRGRHRLASTIATFKTVFDPNCLAGFIRNPESSKELREKLEKEADKIIETPDPYRELMSYLYLSPTITTPGWRKLDQRSHLQEEIKNDPAFKAAEIIRNNLISLLNRFGITEVKIWQWIEEALASAGYINPRERRYK